MNPYYKDYSAFLAEHFDGKVQKLSVDVGFTCPNRDGSIGRGGCIYCNNMAFSPDWDKRTESVAAQIARGKAFFGKKYPDMRYLAYFQSYTSTYAPEEKLLTLYREALAQPDVVGLIIGTRPDCMPDSLLDSIADLGCKVFIEYGETVRRVSALPIATVKFHQLQILKGTRLEKIVQNLDIPAYTADEYAALCARLLKYLRSDIAVERFVAQAPDDLLISPRWGLKNYQFTSLLNKALSSSGVEG